MALTTDRIICPTYSAPDLVTVDDWLYRMWGIHAGPKSAPSRAESTFSYPAPIAEWLFAMWGISVPVAGAD
jgi:hypothetical protein